PDQPRSRPPPHRPRPAPPPAPWPDRTPTHHRAAPRAASPSLSRCFPAPRNRQPRIAASSPEHLPTIHIDDLAGDPGRRIGQQEQTRAHHVVGRSHAFQCHTLYQLGGGVSRLGTGGRSVRRTGCDGVHPDVHTTQFVRELLRQSVHARFRESVETGVEPCRGRTLVHDRPAALLLHVGIHGATDNQRTVHVHVHELAVVLPVHSDQQIELHIAV